MCWRVSDCKQKEHAGVEDRDHLKRFFLVAINNNDDNNHNYNTNNYNNDNKNKNDNNKYNKDPEIGSRTLRRLSFDEKTMN